MKLSENGSGFYNSDKCKNLPLPVSYISDINVKNEMANWKAIIRFLM